MHKSSLFSPDDVSIFCDSLGGYSIVFKSSGDTLIELEDYFGFGDAFCTELIAEIAEVLKTHLER